MYRVFCKIEQHPYYWTKSHTWSEWSWAAELFTLEQARQLAKSKNANFEQVRGRE